MAESRTGPKFGHPTLFLFLVYFSFTSPFLLDLHDAFTFTTCSMTNTTVTSDTSRCTYIQSLSIWRGLARLRENRFKYHPLLFPPMHFPTFLRMFHLCFHHFNNQSNIITIVPILEMRMWMTCYIFLYQRSRPKAFDKLSYSYRTSVAKYFDLVVTIEIYIYWPNIVSFAAHTCAGIVHPNRVNRWPEPQLAALAALAKISAPFGSPIHA